MACNGLPNQQVNLETALAESGLVVKDDRVYRTVDEVNHPIYMDGVYQDAGVVAGKVVSVEQAEAQLDYAQK